MDVREGGDLGPRLWDLFSTRSGTSGFCKSPLSILLPRAPASASVPASASRTALFESVIVLSSSVASQSQFPALLLLDKLARRTSRVLAVVVVLVAVVVDFVAEGAVEVDKEVDGEVARCAAMRVRECPPPPLTPVMFEFALAALVEREWDASFSFLLWPGFIGFEVRFGVEESCAHVRSSFEPSGFHA